MQRRLVHLIVISCLIIGLVGGSVSRAESDFKVTLLGTGTPIPLPNRAGPSTLVEAGDQKLLFDAGRFATVRLWQLRVPLGKIDVLFLTHYHSDHTSGIPDLWLTGWLTPPFGTRRTPFRVIGPVGAKDLVSNLEKAYAGDIKLRLSDQPLPREGIAIVVTEYEKEGAVYENNGVKVIAFEVDHGETIKPAYGYRIEYKGRSVVISGDTTFNKNVIKYGSGADVLVHQVAMAKAELRESVFMRAILSHHTSPREAGIVFSQTKPKMAVYTHYSLFGNDKIGTPTVDELVAETRQTYDGPLIVGEDLMSFEIGDTITVVRNKP